MSDHVDVQPMLVGREFKGEIAIYRDQPETPVTTLGVRLTYP